MNTITWLVLGHLVGDWMLQNDWMAKGKKTAFFATPGVVHYFLYTFTVLAFLFFDGARGNPAQFYILVALLLFGSHWLIDATDIVERWMRFYHQTANPTVRLMVDQTIHLLILTLIAVWVSI